MIVTYIAMNINKSKKQTGICSVK